jgi:hypothetical protein
MQNLQQRLSEVLLQGKRPYVIVDTDLKQVS